MKHWRLISILVLSLLISGDAKSAQRSLNEEELTVEARDFFTTWLLHRNAEEAVKYISANPILGSCMTPDYLDKKERLSRDDILKVFRAVLTKTLERTPEAKSLSELVDSSEGIPPEDDNVIFVSHSLEQYFQIFRLKPVKDPSSIAYICKFDERKSFREAVARRNVYYLVARVKGKESCPDLNFELLWVKERGAWRILTISLLED